jgi:hypothetical protein
VGFEEVAQAPIPSPANFGQGCAGQGELGQGRFPLLDEAFEPPDGGTFVAPTVYLSHEQSEVERFLEVESPELAGSRFSGKKVSALDGALEASVCRPLARHRVMPWGRGSP